MSSETSARNPESLAEAAPAAFVNEGVCVCVFFSVVRFFGISPPPLYECMLSGCRLLCCSLTLFSSRFILSSVEAIPLVLSSNHTIFRSSLS